MLTGLKRIRPMAFPNRLATLRKERALTQQALADAVNLHVTQLRRYEAGSAQPTLDVLRRLALALRTTTDDLVFDGHQVGPDDSLRLQFEAIKHLDPDEKKVVLSVLESILVKHEALRWLRPSEAR